MKIDEEDEDKNKGAEGAAVKNEWMTSKNKIGQRPNKMGDAKIKINKSESKRI